MTAERTMTDRQLPRRFLTSIEAAEYLRLAVRTLQDMRVDGTGPAYYKMGPGRQAKVVYTLEDLDAWVAQYQYRSTSEYQPGGRG